MAQRLFSGTGTANRNAHFEMIGEQTPSNSLSLSSSSSICSIRCQAVNRTIQS